MKANKTRPTVCGVGVYLQDKYSIGLIFRGSKFLQITIFEDFVEITSRIHCTLMPHMQTVTLSSPELTAVSKAMPTSKVSLLGVSSLRIRQFSTGMLSIDALAVRAWKLCNVSKIFGEIFTNS